MFRLSIWTAGERLTVLQVAELRKEVDRKSARNAEKRHHTNPAQLFARTALVQVGAAAVPALLGPASQLAPAPHQCRHQPLYPRPVANSRRAIPGLLGDSDVFVRAAAADALGARDPHSEKREQSLEQALLGTPSLPPSPI